MATEQFVNFGEATLNGNINSSVTSLTVYDGSALPSAGDTRLVIGSEVMKMTARSSNTLTVTRGQEGSTAASHNDGDKVRQLITKGGLDAWLKDNRGYDTTANLPTVGLAGRYYIPTDGNTIAIDDGSTWQNFGPIKPGLTPPVDADFSWVNQGSSTVSTTRGGVYLYTPPSANFECRLRYKAKTAPYKITMHFIRSMANANYPQCGMGFRSSVSGKIMTIDVVNASNEHYVEVLKNNDPSTNGSQPIVGKGRDVGSYLDWFQIEDNNTNLYFRYGVNGKMWITFYSESRTSFFSGGNPPTGAFFHVMAQNTTHPCAMHVLHWLEE